MPLDIHPLCEKRADVLRELIGARDKACRGIASDLLAIEVVRCVAGIAAAGIETVLHKGLGTHTRNGPTELDMEEVHRDTQVAGHLRLEMRRQHKAHRVGVGHFRFQQQVSTDDPWNVHLDRVKARYNGSRQSLRLAQRYDVRRVWTGAIGAVEGAWVGRNGGARFYDGIVEFLKAGSADRMVKATP